MVTSLRKFLLIALLLLLNAPLRADEPLPATKKAWIDRLARIGSPIGEDYGAMVYLLQGDPELANDVLREGWPRFYSRAMKLYLLETATNTPVMVARPGPKGETLREEGVHPHLLDILELGLKDRDDNVRRAAAQHLFGIAFQDFADHPTDFAAWRTRTQGSLEERMRLSLREFLTSLRTLTDDKRLPLLHRLADTPFSSGTTTYTDINGGVVRRIDAAGLIKLRRNVAINDETLATLIPLLGPGGVSPEVRETAMLAIIRMQFRSASVTPFAEQMRPELLRMMEDRNGPNHRQAEAFLGLIQAPWATKLLLNRIAETFPDANDAELLTDLFLTRDPQAIPTLIALLDSDELQPWQAERAEQTLHSLTKVPMGKTATNWHGWWNAHRAELPPAVRELPFPRLQAAPTRVMEIRRRLDHYQIGPDNRLGYWLVSPGILLTKTPTAEAVRPGVAPAPDPFSDHAGLVVVLLNGDVNYRTFEQFWMKVGKTALQNHYLIALVYPPNWAYRQAVPWVTVENRVLVPEAKITTEEFVRRIVVDVSARYPLSPQHVYLHGAGLNGPAVYACSLDPTTPFAGFSVLSSEFRAAKLPPLTAAKGRRYYLQQSREEKSVPYFLAAAAQQSLTRAGATVTLKTLTGEHPDAESDELVTHLGEAIRWLEGPKPK